MEPSWSLGVRIGLPILLLLLAAGITIWIWVGRLEGYEADFNRRAFRWISGIGIGLTVVIGAVSFYPYKAEYHQWQPVSGTVAKVDKRLIGNGKGMEEKFVVVFVGSGQQYGCNDTRCASVRPGDSLTITCKRTWQFAGTDGYDCNFVSTETAS